MPKKMTTFEYIVSERWIHDDLLKKAEEGLRSLLPDWRKNGRIAPFLISWPAEDIRADDGSVVRGAVCYDLPEDAPKRLERVKEAVAVTQPYGLLLCEQLENEVCAIFETQHGAKSWHYPIERHGPDRVLGRVSTTTDVRHIGLLWRPAKAEA
jgi:hypothetical protein